MCTAEEGEGKRECDLDVLEGGWSHSWLQYCIREACASLLDLLNNCNAFVAP